MESILKLTDINMDVLEGKMLVTAIGLLMTYMIDETPDEIVEILNTLHIRDINSQ